VGVRPAAWIEVEALLGAQRRFAQRGRDGGKELETRRGQERAETELGHGGRRAGEEEGSSFVGSEPGQVRAVAIEQPVAAPLPALTLERHPRRPKLDQVAVDRARRDLQLLGQRFGSHLATGLQQEQFRNESRCAHGGAFPKSNQNLTRIVRKCRVLSMQVERFDDRRGWYGDVRIGSRGVAWRVGVAGGGGLLARGRA